MQYLAIFRTKPDVSGETLHPVLKPEAAKAWEMLKEGVVRSLWYLPAEPPTHKGPAGAVLLFECADEEEAKKQINRFPLVQNGLVSIELLTLNPCTAYEALFANPD